MTKLEVEIHDDVVSIIQKIKTINDSGIELEIPEGSVIFDNILNIKLLYKEAERFGISLHIITADSAGNNMLAQLDDTNEGIPSMEPHEEPSTTIENRINLPILSLPKIKGITLPKISIKGIPIIIGVVIAALIFGGTTYLTRTQKAQALIRLSSQSLGRSVTIRIATNPPADTAGKEYIKGSTLSANIETSKEMETTGQKDVGEKAKGEVKIFNNTDSDKKFKKGTTLIYEKDNVDYKYITSEDVDVPGRTTEMVYNEDLDVDQEINTPGSKTASVEAFDIGDKYNIKEDTALVVSGQKSSSFYARVEEDIKGGKSEKVKVVTAEDKTKLKNELLTAATEEIEKELLKKLGKEQELIRGSYKTTILKESYSQEDNAVADKISLTLSVQAEALIYTKADLTKKMNSIIDSMIPEGFEIADKNTEYKADVLGNSSNSILNASEADLQVTAKAYIVTALDKEALKKELSGKSLSDAEKILGSIRDVKSYSLTISPNIPLLKKIPKNPDQITLEVEKE